MTLSCRPELCDAQRQNRANSRQPIIAWVSLVHLVRLQSKSLSPSAQQCQQNAFNRLEPKFTCHLREIHRQTFEATVPEWLECLDRLRPGSPLRSFFNPFGPDGVWTRLVLLQKDVYELRNNVRHHSLLELGNTRFEKSYNLREPGSGQVG